jgi:hypothetical protein
MRHSLNQIVTQPIAIMPAKKTDIADEATKSPAVMTPPMFASPPEKAQ